METDRAKAERYAKHAEKLLESAGTIDGGVSQQLVVVGAAQAYANIAVAYATLHEHRRPI